MRAFWTFLAIWIGFCAPAFAGAHAEVQAWFASRRRKPDLTTEQWRSALDHATKLHDLGLLDAAPRGLRGKPGQ